MLEDAARREDILALEKMHDIFIKEWRSYKEKLQDCMRIIEKDKPKQEKQGFNQEEVVVYLEQLRNAFEEMDLDAMDEHMASLEKYQYPDAMQADIQKLGTYVTNMEIDEGIELIERIKSSML